ncbi:MAG: mechanosensitive ion channel domain-containing protein [Vicinamibacterales bacterium]
MNNRLNALRIDMLDPTHVIGATVWAVVFLIIALVLAAAVRRFGRHLESRLSDVTGLRFASAFARVLVYLASFLLYAHLIPALRALGTALLAGVSVVSVVLGLAAQSTLGNLVAGVSLVLYRPVRVGDNVQLNSPKGLITATVERVSLGYTVLRDAESSEIIVPNSVMAGSVVIRLRGTTASFDSTAG